MEIYELTAGKRLDGTTLRFQNSPGSRFLHAAQARINCLDLQVALFGQAAQCFCQLLEDQLADWLPAKKHPCHGVSLLRRATKGRSARRTIFERTRTQWESFSTAHARAILAQVYQMPHLLPPAAKPARTRQRLLRIFWSEQHRQSPREPVMPQPSEARYCAASSCSC